jgi:tripartite-type tricarboxylate transporter receptor subunit TctC
MTRSSSQRSAGPGAPCRRGTWWRRALWSMLAALPAALPAQPAGEAPFAGRGPIELTVLFPAGSSADVTARLLAEGMARHLGTPVLVVNRPGAGGAIGYRHVAAQKPDGLSLVWNSNSISTTYHSGQMNIDHRAFEPVARALAETPVVAVRSNAPWRTLQELVADAKARPRQITVGNSGIGSHTQVSSAVLFRAAGAEVTDVPFAAAQVVPSLVGGHVDALVQLPAAVAPLVAAGQLRLLAALAPQRDPALPQVPTAHEQGVDVSAQAWRGIAAPRGTPRPVIAALEAAIRQTVASAGFARACETWGVRPAFLPAAEFGELIAREDAEMARMAAVIGLRKP